MAAASKFLRPLYDNVIIQSIFAEFRWILRIVRSENRENLRLQLKLAFRKLFRQTLLFLWRWGRYIVGLLAPDLIIQIITRHTKLLAYLILLSLANKVFIMPLFGFLKYVMLMMFCGPTETKERQRLRAKMKHSPKYDGYRRYGTQLDIMDGRYHWRDTPDDRGYNWQRIKQERFDMNDLARKDDIRGLMNFLRSRLVRGSLGITRPELYNVTRIGTKKLIEKYIKTISRSLSLIVKADTKEITIDEKLGFFNEVRHTHGRSALCLSGGSRFGLYHLGVVAGLHEKNLIPRIITGASAGSYVGAIAAVRTDEELTELFNNIPLDFLFFSKDNASFWTLLLRRIRRIMWTGVLLDTQVLVKSVKDNVGDYTFLEAYEKTGRILAISVLGKETTTVPRLLNYLTAPNVLIWSAVVASCAIPGIYASQELMVRQADGTTCSYFLKGVEFSDGGFGFDIPTTALAHLFNVNNFVVSQVNPHILPLQKMPRNIPFVWPTFNFIVDEFRLFCNNLTRQMLALGVFSSTMRTINDTITQPVFGDVTIFPDFEWSDYLKIITNPTRDELNQMIDVGRQSTYPHISRMNILCAIEYKLGRCLQRLRAMASNNEVKGENPSDDESEEEKPSVDDSLLPNEGNSRFSRVRSFVAPGNVDPAMRRNASNNTDEDTSAIDERLIPVDSRSNSLGLRSVSSRELRAIKSESILFT